jgi:hypothetical protein
MKKWRTEAQRASRKAPAAYLVVVYCDGSVDVHGHVNVGAVAAGGMATASQARQKGGIDLVLFAEVGKAPRVLFEVAPSCELSARICAMTREHFQSAPSLLGAGGGGYGDLARRVTQDQDQGAQHGA